MNTLSFSAARRLLLVACCVFAEGCCTLYSGNSGPPCAPSCNPLDCVACKIVEIAVLNASPAQELAPEAAPAGPQAY